MSRPTCGTECRANPSIRGSSFRTQTEGSSLPVATAMMILFALACSDRIQGPCDQADLDRISGCVDSQQCCHTDASSCETDTTSGSQHADVASDCGTGILDQGCHDGDGSVDCAAVCEEVECGMFQGCYCGGCQCGCCDELTNSCLCLPACEDPDTGEEFECGDDGCCGSCGECEEHFMCENHQFVYVPWCGDGTCDVEEGENCTTCPQDCPCG